MSAIFYKKLFEIQLYHNIVPGVLSAHFGLEPTQACSKLLSDYRMVYRVEAGKLTVYYSGDIITDEGDPGIKTLHAVAIPADGTVFTFIVKLLNASIARQTVIPASGDILVSDTNKAIPWHFTRSSLFSLQFPETAQTSSNELFSVKDEKSKKVYETFIDRNDDGNCVCSVDLSFCAPGIYSFSIASDNSLTQKYYIDTIGELSGHYGFLRIVKDNTWKMPDAVSPPSATPDHDIFQYTFEKI